jgi:hypothetical protein
MNDLSDRALLDITEARRFVYRDENDNRRDDLLVDAINDASDSIWDHCEREFRPTTSPARAGTDGVGNATTTFVAATGAFSSTDVGLVIHIGDALYSIVSVTNATTVELDSVLATGTSLAWDFGEAREFGVSAGGYVDLRPYDLRLLQRLTLYADRADLDDEVLTEYQLENEGPASGTWYAVRIAKPSYQPLHVGFGTRITIAGQWGMASIPHSVKLAAKQWVKNIAENPGSYSSSELAGFSVVPDVDTLTLAPAGMPAAVRYRLDAWARGGPVIQ